MSGLMSGDGKRGFMLPRPSSTLLLCQIQDRRQMMARNPKNNSGLKYTGYIKIIRLFTTPKYPLFPIKSGKKLDAQWNAFNKCCFVMYQHAI
jgi:hypothetical protein